MSEFLPKEVRDGLEAARRRERRSRSRLRVYVGGEVFPILRLWDDGFALDAGHARHLRGLVDLYEGARHLSECLIVASVEDDRSGEIRCEFKRQTPARDAPPRDYFRDEDAPVALIGR